MTEDEAKTKWCPFARASNANDTLGTTVNRNSKGTADDECHCIGSACMAWRWLSRDMGDPFNPSSDDGFCGLAGKP